MPQLTQTLAAWQTDRFTQTLKGELEGMPSLLPLSEALPPKCYLDDSDVGVNVGAVSDSGATITAAIEVFFAAIPIGCACGEGASGENAYCEMRLTIDKVSAETTFEITARGD